MKTSWKSILFSLLVAPLAMTSCSGNSKSVIGLIDLDAIYAKNNSEEVFFSPTALTSDELKNKIDSKQDFLLYFHSNNCGYCKETDALFNQYYLDTNQPFKIYSYLYGIEGFEDFVASDPSYENMFAYTPKIYLFKDGKLNSTMSSNRFYKQKVFNKGINSYLKKGNLYASNQLEPINEFTDNDEYLIYFVSENNEGNKEFSFNYYEENIYQNMSHKTTKTLVVNDYDLCESDRNELYEKLGLDTTISSWAIYKYKDSISKFNYSKEKESDLLISQILSLK